MLSTPLTMLMPRWHDLSTHSERPSTLAKDTLPDVTIPMEIHDVGVEPVVNYEFVDGATRSGNNLLIDSNMYTCKRKDTGQKSQQPGKATWRCSVRSKSLTCLASVLQGGNTFTHGLHPHIHPVDPTVAVRAKVTARVKEASGQNPKHLHPRPQRCRTSPSRKGPCRTFSSTRQHWQSNQQSTTQQPPRWAAWTGFRTFHGLYPSGFPS